MELKGGHLVRLLRNYRIDDPIIHAIYPAKPISLGLYGRIPRFSGGAPFWHPALRMPGPATANSICNQEFCTTMKASVSMHATSLAIPARFGRRTVETSW
jgi:hypothetical protein